jgi:short-subunit dehydrogenase
MNPETVLITGASSGIGLELAHVFAREGYNVVGIAEHDRRLRSAMRGLEHEYGVRAWGLVQDLTSPVAVEKINAFLKAEKITVDVLINNAGFGIFGEFIATDWVDERELIELNIISLTELTKHFAQQMAKRGQGKILNIASIASFFPGVRMDTYYASKAYVLSFSLALAEELRMRGVQVSVLCPGPTRTGFETRSHATRSRLFGRAGDARKVAEVAFRGVKRSKLVIIPGLRNKLNVFLSRFVPHKWLARIVRKVN